MKDRLCWRSFLVLLSGLICVLPMMSLRYRTYRWLQRSKQCIFLAILLFVVCGIILTGRSRFFARLGATRTKDGNTSTRLFGPDKFFRKTVDEPEHVGFRMLNGSNGNTSTRWFDPDELLRKTVDELKHVGFQMPSGNIALRIMKMGGGFHPGQKEATDVPKEGILATAERWKVVYVGCFYCRQNRPALSMVSVVTVQSSVGNCVKKCAQLGKAYVSIFAGRMCRCGSGLFKGALGMLMGPQQCRMKCQDGSTQSCGDEERASVYRIAKHENETLTMNRIRRTSAGCFTKPEKFDTIFKFHTKHPTLNVAECLVHCEKDNFVIAAWDASQVCQCGQFNTELSLRQMGLPVNDSLCDSTCVGESQTCSTKHVRIMRTYAKDDRCDDRNITSRSIGRLVALISFPGSGNTWVRYLIEMATGIYSGSVYNDPDLYKNGFIGEFLPWNSRRTSVIKTHQFAEKDVAMFEEAIFIVRSPYDAIMAEFNRVRGGHVGYAEPELFRSMEWIYFIAYKMSKWIRSIQHYSVMEKILVIYFEDIVADPIQEVQKMVKFLGYPVTDIERRLACLETNLSGNFKRPKRMLPFEAYSQKSKDTVNSYIKEARRIFESRNLPPLPNYER